VGYDQQTPVFKQITDSNIHAWIDVLRIDVNALRDVFLNILRKF
jgi:hypothetical protein